MDTFFLNRQPSTDQGTFGELTDALGNVLADTVELPWRDNDHDTSCIPDGSYTVIPHNSAAHPNTWEIANVPNRTGILIHEGNTMRDVLGCVAVGTGRGTVNGLPAVLASKSTLTKLRYELPPSFKLVVAWTA